MHGGEGFTNEFECMLLEPAAGVLPGDRLAPHEPLTLAGLKSKSPVVTVWFAAGSGRAGLTERDEDANQIAVLLIGASVPPGVRGRVR